MRHDGDGGAEQQPQARRVTVWMGQRGSRVAAVVTAAARLGSPCVLTPLLLLPLRQYARVRPARLRLCSCGLRWNRRASQDVDRNTATMLLTWPGAEDATQA